MGGSRQKLYLRTESGLLHTLKNGGKEPRRRGLGQSPDSQQRPAGVHGSSSSAEIYDLVNGSTIVNEDRQELRDAIMVMVTEGLLPAYEDNLRTIRLQRTIMNPGAQQKKHYDDSARALWHGYKDLMPTVVSLLGYNIGFLFQRDGNFKTGLEAFVTENRGNLLLDVGEFLPRQRDGWQQELKTFRNEYLEHQDADVAAQVDKVLASLAWAEKVFIHAWRTAAELIVFLLETRFPPQASITHRAAEKQFPDHPRLYEVHFCDPTQVAASFAKTVA